MVYLDLVFRLSRADGESLFWVWYSVFGKLPFSDTLLPTHKAWHLRRKQFVQPIFGVNPPVWVGPGVKLYWLSLWPSSRFDDAKPHIRVGTSYIEVCVSYVRLNSIYEWDVCSIWQPDFQETLRRVGWRSDTWTVIHELLPITQAVSDGSP
jgi:hypothetical protein